MLLLAEKLDTSVHKALRVFAVCQAEPVTLLCKGIAAHVKNINP